MVGDQTDKEFMQKVAEKGPFDIIVDDADHNPKTQWATYEQLWPAVGTHGFYLIEDCHGSFPVKKGKRSVPMSLAERIPELYDGWGVESIQFYYNLCVIQRGLML